MHWLMSFTEPFLLSVGGIFGIAWLLKVSLYVWGDSYKVEFEEYGQMIMGTFMMYKKYEINEAEKIVYDFECV